MSRHRDFDERRGGHHERGFDNMYASNPRGRGDRFAAPIVPSWDQRDERKKPEIPRKDLIYRNQEFASRPPAMVQDKPNLGEKIEVYTNHAVVKLPEETVALNLYDIEIYQNERKIKKRDVARPLFWQFVRNFPRTFPANEDMIFNDVNQLYTRENQTLEFGNGNLRLMIDRKRTELHWKYAKLVYLGPNAGQEQDDQLLTSIIDAIATARSRHVTESNRFSVFKRVIYLVQPDSTDPALDGIALYKHFNWGTDARVGVSMAVKLNLRAGMTACFDLNHTLFTRPGYPLVRLFVELIRGDVIEDEDFEENFDYYIQNAHPCEAAKRTMARVLEGMSLLYTMNGFFADPDIHNNMAVRNNPGNRKTFRFFELGQSPDQTVFDKTDQYGNVRRVTITEHYLETYGVVLRYPYLPCLVKRPSRVRRNQAVMYPMEMVSYIVNPARYEGFTMDDTRTALIQFSAYTPEQRRLLLEHIIGQRTVAGGRPLINNNDAIMRNCGLEIGTEMITTKATILPVPTLKYGNGMFVDIDHTGKWDAVRSETARTVLEESLIDHITGKKKRLVGSLIIVHTPDLPPDARLEYNTDSYVSLMLALEECGVPIVRNSKTNRPELLDCQTFRQGADLPGDLEPYFRRLQNHVTTTYGKDEHYITIPMIFLIFTSRCSLLIGKRGFDNYYNDYNMIKHLCDNRTGILSQGLLMSNLNTILPDRKTCKLTCHIVEKIIGKMGVNHRVLERDDTHKPWKLFTHPEMPTLVLGIDVCHPKSEDRWRVEPGREPPPKTARQLSVATVVGNIDTSVTQFRASSRVQDCGEEILIRVFAEVKERIYEFMDRTGKRPAHIVVYRDGISEGDFQKILYEEKETIEKVCKSITEDFTPTLTYIVVSKRHHTTFFPMNKEDGDEDMNVKPGTLVEDAVTSTKFYDFFLATQTGAIGTTRPTHYYVLHDTWHPMISFWPTITHALTYTFARTTTTVAIPAPVYYAHLAAKRAMEALDARMVIDHFERIEKDVEDLSEQIRLSKAININKDLDGMVFI